MVLRGDRDPPGGVVDHRHIDATVPEHHLVGAAAQCPAEDLIAETNSEQRDSGPEDRAGDSHDMVRGGRVAGAVGQKHPIGFEFGDLLEGRRRGQHVGANPALREVARGVGLDAEIQRCNGKPLRPFGFHDVAVRSADLAA